MISDTFCALPFTHSCVRSDGLITPCCRFADSEYFDTTTPRTYFKSNKLDMLRKMMLAGESISGCKKCYDEESLGRKSYRQLSNEQYEDFIYDSNPIKYIEVSFNNTCNMMCVMCDPQNSSKWNEAVEEINFDNIFRYKQIKQSDMHLDFTEDDYNSVTKVKLLGGEPFLVKKNIDFLKKFDLKNVEFLTHTNCSITPNDSWKDIFTKCKQLSIRLSIDGMNEVAEFSRNGVEWNIINDNIDWFVQFKEKHNMDLTVHSMCHIYNVFDLNNFVSFLTNKNIGYKFDCVTIPSYLDIKILPKAMKEELVEKINDGYVKNYLQNNIEYTDLNSLQLFFKFTERLQNRNRFQFVDDIVNKIKKVL